MTAEETPPPLPGPPSAVRTVLAGFLNAALVLFLAEALVSLLNESLVLFSGNQSLVAVTGLLGVFSFLVAVVVYGLMALTHESPKAFAYHLRRVDRGFVRAAWDHFRYNRKQAASVEANALVKLAYRATDAYIRTGLDRGARAAIRRHRSDGTIAL